MDDPFAIYVCVRLKKALEHDQASNARRNPTILILRLWDFWDVICHQLSTTKVECVKGDVNFVPEGRRF